MKNRNFIKNSMMLLLPISLGLGVLLGVNKKSVERVDGYSTSALPTTIDLNDTTAANIRSYYSSLNNKTESERQGTNLLKNLKTILKNSQKYYSYDSGNAIWQMYEITDRDWEKSPASAISGYNSSTNKITGYSYGTSTSSKGTNPYIHALYVNRNITNQVRAWDDHQQTQWGINREHVWAKAEGFDSGGSGGARGDAMHLMAGNGYANNIHSNNFFGYVDTSSSSYTNCGTKYSNLSGNLSGKSKTLKTGTVFEPQDSDKGDIARAIFYMVARYNYYSGSDSDGIDGSNPNLALSQSLSDWSSSGFTSSTTQKGYMGVMTDLLAWHHADPVDQYEIHRNNLLYTNFTMNRNPFIDFPEWADFIWGSVQYSGSTYISHSTTPTGYATPSSDTINGYNSGGGSETISVTGVSLNKNSTTITVNGTEILEAVVAPSNATNKNVTWTSSNTDVATVNGGTVRAISQGTSTITVKTVDGNFIAQCTVTVEASGGGGDVPEAGSATISYNDTFSPALPSSKDTINSTDTSHNDTTSSFSFKEQGIYKGSSNNYLMFVENKGFLYNTSDLGTIDSVSVTYSSQTSTSGKIGVYFGTSQQSTYTTTSNQTIKGQSLTDTFTNTTEGNGFFQLSTSNKNVQITQIAVNYHTGSATTKTLTSITLDTTNVKKSFNLNESFEYSGLVVTAHYSDSTTATVTPTNVSSPDMTTIGEKTITVTYATVSASYGIAVHYPGSTSTSQMIVNKSSSTHYVDGAVYLTGSDTSGTAECDAFTATQTKYGGTSSISYNLDEIHVYQNHRFTISPKTGYVISSVRIFASSPNDANRIGGSGLSNCSKTKNDTIVTLTPTSGTSALSFSNSYESSIQFLIVNFEEYTLSWDSPNIDVFSGEALTSTEVNSWSVTDGTTTYTSAQLVIKLGEEIISLPYEWKAEDDGKTLKASVNGVYTPESEPIRVTQTINSVYAATTSTWEHEITEKTWAEAGSQTISGKTWVQDCTIASGNGFWGYDGTKGQQFGSGSSPFSQLTLTSSAFSGTIYSVSVYTSGASGVTGNVLVSVGGTDYGSVKSVTSTNSEYTFNGKSSGEIVIKWTQTSSKALYLKKLVVEYSTGQTDIANNNSHIEAQRVAVKYAKAFNAAMATTQGCTTNLSSAWSVCSSAYTTFLSEAAALGSTEENYAKNLLKYATAQYTDDSGEVCIERMLKTYQVCVQKHGQTPFMSQLVELSNIDVRPLFHNIYKNNKIIVTVLVSFISVSAIGGYFFLKSRKKEEN